MIVGHQSSLNIVVTNEGSRHKVDDDRRKEKANNDRTNELKRTNSLYPPNSLVLLEDGRISELLFLKCIVI